MGKKSAKEKIDSQLIIEVITAILVVVAAITLGFVYLFSLIK